MTARRRRALHRGRLSTSGGLQAVLTYITVAQGMLICTEPCRQGYSNAFVLHCSLQAASGKVFVHAREVDNDSNVHILGLLVSRYIPDAARCQEPSWDGKVHPVVSGGLNAISFRKSGMLQGLLTTVSSWSRNFLSSLCSPCLRPARHLPCRTRAAGLCRMPAKPTCQIGRSYLRASEKCRPDFIHCPDVQSGGHHAGGSGRRCSAGWRAYHTATQTAVTLCRSFLL